MKYKIKKFETGLDKKTFFTFNGELYLLSTCDITNGNKKIKKTNPWIHPYESMVFKKPGVNKKGYIFNVGEEIWSCRYDIEEEAIENHKTIIKMIKLVEQKNKCDKTHDKINDIVEVLNRFC